MTIYFLHLYYLLKINTITLKNKMNLSVVATNS